MIYLRSINESVSDKKFLEDLKSLPYRDFLNKLYDVVNTKSLKKSLENLTIDTSTEEDYGLIKRKNIEVSQLVPTQSQIGLLELLSWLEDTDSMRNIILEGKSSLFEKNALFVANNKWILDGHHRWAYVYMLNPQATIPCININLPNKKPLEIYKDIQISIASTYKLLAKKGDKIEYNITRMSDKSIEQIIHRSIDPNTISLLRKLYGSIDFEKLLIKSVIPDVVNESDITKNLDSSQTGLVKIKSNLSKELPPPPPKPEKDPGFNLLEQTDKENEKDLEDVIEDSMADKIQSFVDILGIFDPTPTLNVLNGVGYLYRGEYLKMFAQFAGAIPVGEIIARPIMALMKSKIIAKLARKFGKYLTELNVAKISEVMTKLEKHSPVFGKLFRILFDSLGEIVKMLGKVLEKIGPQYPKFKIFYNLLTDTIPNFFEKIKNYKEKIKEFLNEIPESQILSMLKSNVIKIKSMIVDRGIDKYNINYSMGINPIETAIAAKKNPYTNDFFGVPTLLLSELPTMMKKLNQIESVDVQIEEQPEIQGGGKVTTDFQKFRDSTDSKKRGTKLSPESKSKVPSKSLPKESNKSK